MPNRTVMLAAVLAVVLLPLAVAASEPPAHALSPRYSGLVAAIVAEIDGYALVDEVSWLCDLGTRYVRSPNILAVADRLEERLAATGLPTHRQTFPYGVLQVSNIVATQTGTVHPDSVFVICAHYDSISDNPMYVAPGADDNATGTMAVLEAARLLAGHPVEYSIEYVLFTAEEVGLYGSQRWVAAQAAAGVPIVGALNLDMIGWWQAGAPWDLEVETNQASRWLADVVCWAADNYSDLPYELHVSDAASWGDFATFWDYGYAAVNHEEAYDWYDPDFNPWYHTILDRPEELSADFFAGSVRTVVAALATLARVDALAPVAPAATAAGVLSAGPNPFNGRVVLRLESGVLDGLRDIALYDLRGCRVGAVPVDIEGGRGEATWDGRDERGRPLAAGVYVARAEGLPGPPTCRVTYLP